MSTSALASEFVNVTLTYTPPGTGTIVTDDAGNETRSAGLPRKVRAFLKTPRAPNVTAQIGGDTLRVDYEGRLTNPPVPPKDFTTGTSVSFVMDGRTVTGRVRVFAPSPVPDLDAELGRRVQVVADG